MNEKIIKELFKFANKSFKCDNFPVSAIIYKDGKIVSKAYNTRKNSNITTDHAEIKAIIKANKKIKSWRLQGYNMIITLEPCDMCKNIIKEARLDNVFYLVERYSYKKQYEKTNFEYMQVNSDLLENYRTKINTFFSDKR